jgi:hypothetical protein
VCNDRIGEVVRGRVKVDKHGDSVQATNVEGDHWRIRHDMIKCYKKLLFAKFLNIYLILNVSLQKLSQDMIEKEGAKKAELHSRHAAPKSWGLSESLLRGW